MPLPWRSGCRRSTAISVGDPLVTPGRPVVHRTTVRRLTRRSGCRAGRRAHRERRAGGRRPLPRTRCGPIQVAAATQCGIGLGRVAEAERHQEGARADGRPGRPRRVRLVPPRGQPEVEARQDARQQRQRPHALAALPAAAAAPRGRRRPQGHGRPLLLPAPRLGPRQQARRARPAATRGGRRSTRASARRCSSAPPPARAASAVAAQGAEEARRDDGRPAAATRASTTRRCTSRWASTPSAPPSAGRPGAGSRSPASARSPCDSSTTTARTRKARLTYAVNNYRWFRHAAERLRQAGDPVPAGAARAPSASPASSRPPPARTPGSRRSATPARPR